MKTYQYAVFCLMCVIYYILAAFYWEHILATLITSGIWVLIMLYANQKNEHLIKEQEDSIKYWQSQTEYSDKQLNEAERKITSYEKQKIVLINDYNKLLNKVKEVESLHTHPPTNTPSPNNGEIVYDLPVGQSEAAKKLGSRADKIHVMPGGENEE